METSIPVEFRPALVNLFNGIVNLGEGRLKLVRITIGDGDNTEEALPYRFPERGALLYAFTDVRTPQAGATIDVGTLSTASGDADGIFDAISVAAAGLIFPRFVPTVGSNNTYLAAAGVAHTVGALLTKTLIAGEDTAAGGDGFGQMGPYATDGKQLSVTRSGTFTTLDADICLVVFEPAIEYVQPVIS